MSLRRQRLTHEERLRLRAAIDERTRAKLSSEKKRERSELTRLGEEFKRLGFERFMAAPPVAATVDVDLVMSDVDDFLGGRG